jgi:hypothetical protein
MTSPISSTGSRGKRMGRFFKGRIGINDCILLGLELGLVRNGVKNIVRVRVTVRPSVPLLIPSYSNCNPSPNPNLVSGIRDMAARKKCFGISESTLGSKVVVTSGITTERDILDRRGITKANVDGDNISKTSEIMFPGSNGITMGSNFSCN